MAFDDSVEQAGTKVPNCPTAKQAVCIHAFDHLEYPIQVTCSGLGGLKYLGKPHYCSCQGLIHPFEGSDLPELRLHDLQPA